jgi:hypothetical protein
VPKGCPHLIPRKHQPRPTIPDGLLTSAVHTARSQGHRGIQRCATSCGSSACALRIASRSTTVEGILSLDDGNFTGYLEKKPNRVLQKRRDNGCQEGSGVAGTARRGTQWQKSQTLTFGSEIQVKKFGRIVSGAMWQLHALIATVIQSIYVLSPRKEAVPQTARVSAEIVDVRFMYTVM